MKRAEDFDSLNEWVRYSHWLRLHDAMWHYSIIILVVVAMAIAGVPILVAYLFQFYMLFFTIDLVERNHDSRIKYWLSLL